MGFKARKELPLDARRWPDGFVEIRHPLGHYVATLHARNAAALGLDTLPEGKPVRIALSARVLGEGE
jgi:hypothetical protein